jgi:hypothetical protein
MRPSVTGAIFPALWMASITTVDRSGASSSLESVLPRKKAS